MTATLHLDADLRLEVGTGVAEDDPGRRLAARLTGTGSTLTLVLEGLDRLPVGIGPRQAADPVRDVAQLLADEGLTVVVATERGRLFSLGQVRQRLGERTLTGSPHITVHDRRGVLRMMRARGDDGAPALSGLLPPTTPWPVTPTLTPPRRRRVRTTHDPLGGGDPRLVYYLSPPEQGGRREVLHLRRGVTTVGGASTDDLRLPGLEPGELRVEREPDTDEYQVVPVPNATTTVGGRPVDRPVRLRTGQTVAAGGRSFVYVREEYADHGRPYGGREGGEFSRQRPQPLPRYVP
jgi:hypothetical protein